jgi:methionine synthase II (cobalamin-independent)
LTENPIIKPFSTTGIGSLPHADAREAVNLVLESFDIPFWPQLPQLGFRGLMIPQYSEGMPGLLVDEGRGEVLIERNEEETQRFYETCTEDAKIAISEDYAKGLHTFLRKVDGRDFNLLKGHITGPLTYTLGLKDTDGRPIYFDEELREISLMLLNAKARWQIAELGRYADKVIIFIDEPILSALGSTSYVGVSNEEALRLLQVTADAIKDAGGIAGIHCCGRADWPLVMDSGVDIMNFDAYSFADTLGIYPDDVEAFLEADGVLAWGIVPTTEDIENEDEESIIRLFDRAMDFLSKTIPGELLARNIVLTPSCGTGSRTVEETQKIFRLLRALKEAETR